MINWPQIKTVFLDLDGTLLDLNFDNHFWQEFVPIRFAERNEINIEEAKQILKPRFKSMEGKIEWYCLDYWSHELKLDIAALKSEMSDLVSILPHVMEFLVALGSTTKHLVMVTNAHPDSLGIKMDKTCLNKFFDSIISSHDLGLPKEALGFWPLLQQMEPFEKATTLLIDDSKAVLSSARTYGIENLVAISKPDSKRCANTINGFYAVEDFREIMPN